MVFDDATIPTAKQALRDLADRQDIPTRQVSSSLRTWMRAFRSSESKDFSAFYPDERPALLQFLAQNSGGAHPILAIEDPIACEHAFRAASETLASQYDRARSKGRMAFEPTDHAAAPEGMPAEFALFPRVDLERLSFAESTTGVTDLGAKDTRGLRNAIAG